MRFTALLLPIVFGAASAGPCRPSSAESSIETTQLVSSTTIESVFPTATATLTTDDANTTVPATEIELASTTESAAAASSTTASSGQCIAPASLQCCVSVGKANDGPVSMILSLLGIVIKDTSIPIGLTCRSVPNPGACPNIPVCCNGNSYGGLVAISCTSV
ncbi:hypothetical protein FVEN_g5096 [Fusarium venenatum]|uniref:Hydrophobin n=1 Tax=Fusarium venenatum TaxID=56646 RepID=A0A2L2THP6_9HYPO|nr:uncharacterized protein FVRRES_06992 [Fusarium venenatum]KAG8357053.1 hypothetical protein FVEN_g5096 [Fusarium venenatum]KAH6993948.1 hypothetical protein EDB82DRAFT_575455 [Fusarium venenatum]CEI62556.1 unnamed protein product [Fusarium venenatum]